MKRFRTFLLPALVLAAAFTANFSCAQSGQAVATTPPSPGYTVTERGADYKVLQKTTAENGTNHVHSYTELASGLNHLVNGQWVESSEQIDILPNGTAVATNGQHQAYFPGDIYQGQIELVTPDGEQLYSRPVGLS